MEEWTEAQKRLATRLREAVNLSIEEGDLDCGDYLVLVAMQYVWFVRETERQKPEYTDYIRKTSAEYVTHLINDDEFMTSKLSKEFRKHLH